MSHGKSDQELIKGKHNTARFFVETRQVAWVLLILTCLWGVYGYVHMPQRKDPEVQVRTAVALVPWPGSSAEKVEQLVTRKVEEQMAGNSKVTKIESISRTGLAIIYVELDENLKETGKEFDDIKLRLDGIHDLPSGAGPINFIKDFGDTAALLSRLDLLISVDTSVAHLAAAMGRPVWLLLPFNPDWRWLLDREDSPWYDSMRLFRQTRLGDWSAPLAAVRAELARFLG